MKKKKRILSIVFNDMTHDSRVEKEMGSLASAGFDVMVLALKSEQTAYREVRHGFQIRRMNIRLYRFVKSRISSPFIYAEMLLKCLWRYRFDILHIHDIEPMPLAMILKWTAFKKTQLIYDTHEYTLHKLGVSEKTRPIYKVLEKKTVSMADAVICVSDAIAKDYGSLYGCTTVEVIYNCPNYFESIQTNALREEFGFNEQDTIFLYHGGLGTGRGIEIMLEAFASLTEKSKKLVLMGYGSLEEKIKSYARHHEHINFKPAVKPTEVLTVACSADVGLCLIEDINLSYRYSLPNKMFEYAMSGIPVVVSPMTELKRVVEHYDIGVVCAEEGADALRELISSTSRNTLESKRENLKAFSREFAWEEQEKRLLRIYNSL